MTERRRASSKPPPSELKEKLVPRPTRDPSAGRYSMTSETPPPVARKSNAPPPSPPTPSPPPQSPDPQSPLRSPSLTRPGFSAVDPPKTPVPTAARLPPREVPSLPRIPAAPSLPTLGASPVMETEDDFGAPVEAKSAPAIAKRPEKQAPPRVETIEAKPAAKTTTSTKAKSNAVDASGASGASGAVDAPTDVEWQKLWLATQRREWRSLVIVPCGKEVDAVKVARALAAVGSVHLSRAVGVVDATRVSIGDLRPELAALKSRADAGETIVVAVRPVADNPTSASFAETADAAILCVTLGASNLADAARAVDEIGRERFLGTVVLSPKVAR